MIYRTTDCAALAAFVAATAPIRDTDWSKLIGPYGGYFLSLLMLLMFIRRDNRNRKDAAKRLSLEEDSRERRHKEVLQLQKENSSSLMVLNVKQIEAQHAVSVAMTGLTQELRSRPCQAGDPPTTPKRKRKPKVTT